MTPGKFVTIRERNEMRDMARVGASSATIAAAFDVSRTTVRRHCRGLLVRQAQERARLKAIVVIYDATPFGEKHCVAERFGLASIKSLQVSISQYRKRLRASAERNLKTLG